MRRDRLTLTIALASLFLAWPTESSAQTAQPPEPPQAEPPPPLPPPPPPPPTTKPPSAPSEYLSLGGDWKFGFHGIAGVSFYVQDTPNFVLNGQGPLLATNKPGNGFTTGADIRQSRFGFSVSGPKVLGARPKAVLEIDLFGLDSPGDYGEVSAYERLRLAYAELAWENTTLRFGQDHQLIIDIVPESIGHLAFPVTYTAGMIGWREPGVGFFQRIPLGDSDLEFAVQVMKSDWQSPYSLGSFTTATQNVDLGQLSGWPGVEGRVKFNSEHLTAYVAGHWNRVEGTHQKDEQPPLTANFYPGRGNWDVYAGVAALQARLGRIFSLTVSGYYGNNLAPLLGEELQFPPSYAGNILEYGGWGQLGFHVTPFLDITAVGGYSRLNAADLENALSIGGGAGILSNMVGGVMVRFRFAGFAFGPEYYHAVTKIIEESGQGPFSGDGAPDGVVAVNQGMLSAMYFF